MVGSDSVNKSLPVNGAVEKASFHPRVLLSTLNRVRADSASTYYINNSEGYFLCFIGILIILRKTVSNLFKEMYKFFSYSLTQN